MNRSQLSISKECAAKNMFYRKKQCVLTVPGIKIGIADFKG